MRPEGTASDDGASDARTLAERAVAAVAHDPAARLALLDRIYETPSPEGQLHLPYRRAAAAFMRWQQRRGLLNPTGHERPGSPWWRAMNDTLLLDSHEARTLALRGSGTPSTPGAAAYLQFIAAPSATRWYRAHNVSIVSGYVAQEPLAHDEDRVERFFLNLVLVRVLYAHALVAAPRLALDRLPTAAPFLGDPRLGMTGMFLSLSRVLPSRYPLGDDVEEVSRREHGFGRFLDIGIIQPRARLLYDWSARELGLPHLADYCDGPTPCYAWDPADSAVWTPDPSLSASAARRLLPAERRARSRRRPGPGSDPRSAG